MIVFNNEIAFELKDPVSVSNWISNVIKSEKHEEGEINYIFCSDDQLLKKNIKYLNHNTLTDIISFDYTIGNLISGDVFISIDRVSENAEIFQVSFLDELHRVLVHGILHYCGYKDKSKQEKELMRSKENSYLSLRKF